MSTATQTPSKASGSISSIEIKIKDVMDMANVLEVNKAINLFVGKNGTGKTFILKSVWIMSYITQGVIVSRLHNHPLDPIAFTQYVIDHSFDNQTFTGTMKAVFENGPEVEIALEEGKVTRVIHTGLEEITVPVPAIYMSSQMRLFDSMSMYLKLRKLAPGTTAEQKLPAMLKDFKIYDALYIEGVIQKCPRKFEDKYVQMIRESFDVEEDFTEFDVDLEQCDFFIVLKDGSRKYMKTYGAGHQSIFNMFIATPQV